MEGEEIWSKLRQQQEAQRPVQVLTARLIREIVLLRSLLRKPVCSPTYVIDYRGWNSAISSGGQVFDLPWNRSPLFYSLTIDKVESKKFTKFRHKFLSIRDGKTQRRILAAMRRLSSSLEKVLRQ